ncbi:MAG: preprotein translocase subunit SecE [Candidatus Cyclonatronum sp.]|uniref:preprotein translocase subunit SecE n=1 Tax=Cyclonatronum sp. TaxID=3024185 RepID=UPI0025B9A874|nr:preprotein translocase subunit SecE [Cyclonatronum sp.]MCC5933590.1 preprotein translocase subunit SecE [Balneolales bacterium]MCH8486202.1 preprotein translocase subunit SecE [Cyclonatronum sp.]
MSKIKNFSEGVRKEWNKISWPTQKELQDNTAIVVLFSIILSLFIFFIDQIYTKALEFIFG